MARIQGQSDNEDVEAHRIAREVADGLLDEQTGRWQLYALAMSSEVPSVQTGAFLKRYRYTPQDLSDLTDRLQSLLLRKMTGYSVMPDTRNGGKYPDADEPGMRLELIAEGSSFRGWLRSFANKALQSEWRNLTRAKAKATPVAPTSEDDQGSRFAEQAVTSAEKAYLNASYDEDLNRSEAEAERLALEAVMVAYRNATPSRSTEAVRVHRQVNVIKRVFLADIPGEERLGSPEKRSLLSKLLQADADLPTKALRALADHDVDSVDPLIVEVFGDMRASDIRKVLAMPTEVHRALALAAALPTHPPRDWVARSLSDGAALVVGGDAASQSLARRVVSSWIGARSEAVQGIDKDQDAVAADRSRFSSAVRSLLAAGSTDLGSTEGEIAARLESALGRIENDPDAGPPSRSAAA